MGAHLDALDGLRGCMAMVVLLRHAFNAVDLPDATRLAVMQSPLALLQSAQAAIHVFFVMSAFVLARSLARDRSASGVAQYAVKRFFRLHPPYVAGLLLTWLAAFFYVSDPATEEWVRYFAGIHLTVPELLASFSFPGDARMQLPVGWSLRVEMIGSLLLPLILLAAVARVLPLLAAAALVVYLHPEAVWLRWLPDFALGVALYARREALGTAFARMPSWGRALCVAAGWFLFCAPLLLGWTEPGLGLVLAGFDRRAMAVNSLGAAVIVATCVWTPASERAHTQGPSWRFVTRVK